jgi:hypothetical protein
MPQWACLDDTDALRAFEHVRVESMSWFVITSQIADRLESRSRM